MGIKKKSRRNRKRIQEDEATTFEKQYMQSTVLDSGPPAKKMKPLLPIKNKSGVLIQQYEELDEKDDISNADEQQHAKVQETSMETKDTNPLTNVQQIKVEIAGICSNIVNDPQNHIRELKKLQAMLWQKEPYQTCLIVRKLAMASLTCVFVDIIPGYRIREQTEDEMGVKLSKEVKLLVDFEAGLLTHYQRFLNSLEKVIKKDPAASPQFKKREQKEMTALAVKSLCELYEKTVHFNFHNNIAMVLLPTSNSKNKALSEMCCTAITNVFRADKSGLTSLSTVKILAKLVKDGCASKKRVRPEIIETFLSLHINHVDFESMSRHSKKLTVQEKKKAAEEKRKLSRGQRKYLKRTEKLQNELKETEAMERRETKVKYHTETIQQVFLVYFRILKHKEGQTIQKKLLNTVLEGLSQFAHLINIDFFSDLIIVLQKLVTSGDLDFRQKLCCIFTTFRVLSGQGEALNIDPSEFYKHLYSAFIDLIYIGPPSSDRPTRPKRSSEVELIADCMNIMLNKRRRQVTLNRLQAFIKRLCVVSLNVQPGSAAKSMLEVANNLLQSNSKTNGLFDPESQIKGIYLPELEDPEHSGSTSTCLWELHALRRHFCPDVHTRAQKILKDASKL